MAERPSNGEILTYIYLFILLRYFLWSDNYFDMQFIVSTILIGLMMWIYRSVDNKEYTEETKQIIKFLAHMMFISLVFSLLCDVISIIYGIIFYFGFVNTMVIGNIIVMSAMAGLVDIFKDKISKYLSRTHIGNWLMDMMNYYYNTYIVSKKIYETIILIFKYVLVNYVWYAIKFIFNKFVSINSEFSANNNSELVKKKLNNKCNGTKDYFFNQIMQPYIVSSLTSTINSNAFSLDTSSQIDENLIIPKMSYKNNLTNQNMDMSFLEKTKIEETNDLDDLDDLDDLEEDIDLLEQTKNNVPKIEITPTPISASTTEIKPNIQTPTFKQLTTEEKKALLRKKLAEKKAARTMGSSNRNRTTQRMAQPNANVNSNANANAAEMMKNPFMGKMMETILQGDNLEKLMKTMPQNQQMPPISQSDMSKVKHFIREMNKQAE